MPTIPGFPRPPAAISLLPSPRFWTALFACAGLAAGDVVISQVYGGGGNAGATLTHDFVELHNRGPDAADLTGWSVQYASSAGSTWQRTLLSGSIPAGGYYLVQQAQGAGGTAPLPAPEVTGTIAMSASAGKVALSGSDALLAGTCPGGLLDLVGYGAADCFEGAAAAPGLNNANAALRGGSGCEDTGNNGSDFASGTPAPRNSSAPAFSCVSEAAPRVISTSPADSGANARSDGDVGIVFSEPVAVSGNWFSLSGSMSGMHAATVSGGPVAFALHPDADFLPGETVQVTVFAAQVSDLDLADPPDRPAADLVFSFTVAAPARIAEIQGRGHRSPLEGRFVLDVPGIVTAVRSNGFYLQDPDTDQDPATSEALFVFTGSAPTVAEGDALQVEGRVTEFRAGGSGGLANLTLTELTAPGIRKLSSGNAPPPATLLGRNGRRPPRKVIDDDAAGDVETSGTFDAEKDGIDFYESLESMRVRIPDPVVVGPTNAFGEFVVVGDGGAASGKSTPRGGIKIGPDDFNPERILVDDALMPVPAVKVGDGFAGSIAGVLDYGFGNFKVLADELPAVRDGGLEPETARRECRRQLSVATFNVENLDPADPQEKFDRLAAIIVHNLGSPLLLALEEVQDNNGPVNDGTVDASLTYARLISAVLAAGGPRYDFRDIPPEDGRDGGEPGGNIRVGFLFQPDQGLVFTDRPGGTATDPVQILAGPQGPRLNFSPGRIDPINPAFANSRKPLAAEFTFRGRSVFLVANHFNSKGGDQPLFGRFQPPQRPSEIQRGRQAMAVQAFAASLLSKDAQARLIVLGDFNDFEFSRTLSLLKGCRLANLMETLPGKERYSYVFEGNSQALDHILVSKALAKHSGAHYEVVHVNSEFPDPVSDHEPQRACFDM